MGKFVAGVIGCFAIPIFAIPVGIFGAGFEEYITAEKERQEAARQSGATCEMCNALIYPEGLAFVLL
jgi:hypothetical protein